MVGGSANRLSLEMLTLFGMPPVEHAKLAAELGCAAISLGLSGRQMADMSRGKFEPYPDWSLLTDRNLRRELKEVLADSGLVVSLGEGFRVLPGRDIYEQAEALDIMAGLGARHINGGSMDPDIARTYDQLALLAEMTQERGMRLSLEFAPSNTLSTFEKAMCAVEVIGRERCDLLVDAMHFFRSGATLEDMTAAGVSAVGYAQLCDVPLVSDYDTYIEEAMYYRLAPGEGELPLREWIAALPEGIWIGLEVPSIGRFREGVTPRDHARHVVEAARALDA